MKIKDIYSLEQSNKTSILLHKEGLFWRAYEYSAYLFVLHIKPYQVIKKFYKNIKSEIVYLGFPESALEQILQTLNNKSIEKKDNQIIIANYQIDNNKFTIWKNEIKLGQNSKKPEFSNDKILDKIRNFSIVNKTPIECQQFILEIQTELNSQTNGTLQ